MLASASLLLALALGAPIQPWPQPALANIGQAGPKSVSLSPEQLFAFAERARQQGDLRTTEAAYKALSANPDANVRNEARLRRSRLLNEQGRSTQASVLLRQILDERPDAAPVRLELAQLLDRMGDKDAAWREIRAVQATALPPAVARLVDRYSEALGAARPIGASFEIAIAPDSNIGRATRSNTLGTVIGDFDIDEDSKAKSGVGLALRGQAYRRLQIGSTDHSLLVRASGTADLYRDGRFNDIAFDLAAGPEIQLGSSRLVLEAGVTQHWFGQAPHVRVARFGGSWTRPMDRRTRVWLAGSAAVIDNRLNDLQDGKSFSAQVRAERALSATTGIGLSLGADRQSAKEPGYSTTGWRLGLLGWRDIGRATLTAGVEVGQLKADERLLLFPSKRQDSLSRWTLGATFRRLTFGGFAPVTRFVVERNRSTIEFYDYKRTRTEFGVVRAF